MWTEPQLVWKEIMQIVEKSAKTSIMCDFNKPRAGWDCWCFSCLSSWLCLEIYCLMTFKAQLKLGRCCMICFILMKFGENKNLKRCLLLCLCNHKHYLMISNAEAMSLVFVAFPGTENQTLDLKGNVAHISKTTCSSPSIMTHIFRDHQIIQNVDHHTSHAAKWVSK